MDDKMEKKARNLALYMLARRRRSRFELGSYLTRKGFTRIVTDSVLDRLEEYGYINDPEYARYRVRSRLGKNGFRWLRQDLRAKGLSSGTIEQVLDEYGFNEEYRCAVELAKKEESRHKSGYTLQKILVSLNRRGYSYAVISKYRYDFT